MQNKVLKQTFLWGAKTFRTTLLTYGSQFESLVFGMGEHDCVKQRGLAFASFSQYLRWVEGALIGCC